MLIVACQKCHERSGRCADAAVLFHMLALLPFLVFFSCIYACNTKVIDFIKLHKEENVISLCIFVRCDFRILLLLNVLPEAWTCFCFVFFMVVVYGCFAEFSLMERILSFLIDSIPCFIVFFGGCDSM
jgi:hypothetical protein